MPNAGATGFPIGSKILQKKWRQKEYKLHQVKVRSSKANLKNEPPSTYPHLVLKLKRVQMEEQKQQAIDHDNSILLRKMTYIMGQPGKLDNWNPEYEPKSLNRPFMDKCKEKVAIENVGIAKRLESIKPTYKARSWETDFSRRHEYVLWLRSNTTKDYEMAPRPLNSKQEENLAEQDSKQLYKSIKGLLLPGEMVVKHLIRRTHKQRLDTAKKFDDIYDLNLCAELRQVLGRDYDSLINCLLAEQELSDVHTIKKAIHDNDVNYLVEYICTAIVKSLPALQTDYSKRFDCLISEDIRERIVDEECQLLLIALFKDDRCMEEEVTSSVVHQDAAQLYQWIRSKEGRFTDEEGVFMELINTRSVSHIRATFQHYITVSGGITIMQSMEEDGCSAEFIEAVNVLCGCLVTGPMYWATKLNSMLRGSNTELIQTLLIKSDTEMNLIRRAFKKKYGQELIDQIVRRCGAAGPMIAQIVNRGGTNLNTQMLKKKDPIKSKQPSASSTPRRLTNRPTHKMSVESMQALKNSPFAQNTKRPLGEALKIRLEEEKEKQNKSKAGPSKKPAHRVPPIAPPTQRPHPPGSKDDDVTKLTKLLEADVIETQTISELLTSLSAGQRVNLAKKYQEATQKNLLQELRACYPADCGGILKAYIMSHSEYDATCIHTALHESPRNDVTLMGMFISKSAKDIKSIKSSYKNLFGQDLAEDLWGEASGECEEMLVHLAAGNRDGSDTTDQKRAMLEASMLVKNEDKTLDVIDPLFKDLLIKRNLKQLDKTFQEIEQLTGKTLEEAIADTDVGSMQEFYVTLIQILKYPTQFTLQLLNFVINKNITDEIARLLCQLTHVKLRELDQQYKEAHEESISGDINTYCHGPFKELILSHIKMK